MYSPEFSLRFREHSGENTAECDDTAPKLQGIAQIQLDRNHSSQNTAALQLTFGVGLRRHIQMDLVIGNLAETLHFPQGGPRTSDGFDYEDTTHYESRDGKNWSVERFYGSHGMQAAPCVISSLVQPSELESDGAAIQLSSPTEGGVCCGSLPAASINSIPQGWIVRVADTRLVVLVGYDDERPCIPWDRVRSFSSHLDLMYAWTYSAMGRSQVIDQSAFDDSICPYYPAKYVACVGMQDIAFELERYHYLLPELPAVGPVGGDIAENIIGYPGWRHLDSPDPLDVAISSGSGLEAALCWIPQNPHRSAAAAAPPRWRSADFNYDLNCWTDRNGLLLLRQSPSHYTNEVLLKWREEEKAAKEAKWREEEKAAKEAVNRELVRLYNHGAGSPEDMKRVNEKLRERVRTKLNSKRAMQNIPVCCECNTNYATHAFNPCGHVFICDQCRQRHPNFNCSFEKCPICQTKRKGSPLRIYLSKPLPVSGNNIIPFL